MPNLFQDTSKVWVIFDTCTRPEYYLDLHNLLALPVGATLRYNYREKYLSLPAVAASLHPSTAPKFGLLFYAQRNGFHTGEAAPETGTIYNEMLWVPTRIIEMLCIPARDGETFNYDFKVLGYPSIDQESVSRVLHPLIQQREIPFNKWVAISSELSSFENLKRGDERRKWGTIVSELHKSQFQFSSDVFWRIIGPKKSRTSKQVSPRYEQTFESGALRLVKAVYDLEEGQNYSFEIVSMSPPRSDETAQTQYSVKCSSTNDDNMEVIGSGSVSLRQQAADSVQFVGKISEEIADHSATLRFETQPKTSQWPMGPELEVQVAVVKNALKIALGLIVGVVGLILSAYGMEILQSFPEIGISCLAIGIILVIIAAVLISRKLILKS